MFLQTKITWAFLISRVGFQTALGFAWLIHSSSMPINDALYTSNQLAGKLPELGKGPS
jgi:hypothetical protein